MGSGFRLYKDDETPLYVQAADALRASISDGVYRHGDRLPSVRRLSDELGVNPATIVAAYRILTKEGFIEARPGSGAFVSTEAPVDERSSAAQLRRGPDSLASIPGGPDTGSVLEPIDMAANAPPLDMFPLEDMKRFIVEAIDADGGKAFAYQDTAGYPPLKKAIADHLSLGSHIVRQSIDPQDVHIVSGAQQGIDLVARILLRRGDVAALESPGYRGARDAFIAAGARIVPLPVNGDGLDLQALERLASSRSLRLVHVNPSFQNPTGVLYSANNRSELASLAERYGFYIVEDDLFSDLSWDCAPIPSIRSFDAAGRVLFVKSFSKCLMPGLRIACLEAPAAFRERIEGVKRSIDISSNGLMQRVLERFLLSGRFDEHLVSARRRYKRAFHAFDSSLDRYHSTGLEWGQASGGINLWITLPPGVQARALSAACLGKACLVAAESSFRYDQAEGGDTDSHIRVSFGSIPMKDIERGARAIGEATLSLLSTKEPRA
ncbi:MAG: PLP-dependent aminotransferase family protein [Spirochaetia bacterium]|jgi:DNA-binding transcriptional MocR family regulator|nr:PLP-dependent aminotransferase family protein [Spirochaetia bacterium]